MSCVSSKLLFFIFIAAIYNVANAQEKEINIARLFNGVEGCFMITKVDNTEQYYYNKKQCLQTFSPCSTFKIVNSLIALQTGVVTGADYEIRWDSIQHPRKPWMEEKLPFKNWMQDHTLESAFKNSVVWYYQEIARRIGNERMQKHLSTIGFGNNDLSGGIDQFWLCGSLQISAKQQVQFLRRFYNEELKVIKNHHIQTVKYIMLYKTTDNYKIYGKTGGGDCIKGGVVGWYVGIVECDKGAYAFAMNMLAKDFSAFDNNKRIEISLQILSELGYI